jgi:hypothetical protein
MGWEFNHIFLLFHFRLYECKNSKSRKNNHTYTFRMQFPSYNFYFYFTFLLLCIFGRMCMLVRLIFKLGIHNIRYLFNINNNISLVVISYPVGLNSFFSSSEWNESFFFYFLFDISMMRKFGNNVVQIFLGFNKKQINFSDFLVACFETI